MAITQAMCTSFKAEILDEQHDLAADTLKIALYTSSASLDAATTAYTTSNEISGTELNNLGVLHKLCSLEDMDKEFESLIESLNKQSFISICMIKQQIREGLDKTFSESLDLETENQNKRFLHSDAAEGMSAFLDKRPPVYKNTLDE